MPYLELPKIQEPIPHVQYAQAKESFVIKTNQYNPEGTSLIEQLRKRINESPVDITVPAPLTKQIPKETPVIIEVKPALPKLKVETSVPKKQIKFSQNLDHLENNSDPKTMDKFPLVGDYSRIEISKGKINTITEKVFVNIDGILFHINFKAVAGGDTKKWTVKKGENPNVISEYVQNIVQERESEKAASRKSEVVNTSNETKPILESYIKESLAKGESIEIALKNFEANNLGYEHTFELFSDPITKKPIVRTKLFKDGLKIKEFTAEGVVDIMTGRISIVNKNGTQTLHSNFNNWNKTTKSPKIELNRKTTPADIAPTIGSNVENKKPEIKPRVTLKQLADIQMAVNSGSWENIQKATVGTGYGLKQDFAPWGTGDTGKGNIMSKVVDLKTGKNVFDSKKESVTYVVRNGYFFTYDDNQFLGKFKRLN